MAKPFAVNYAKEQKGKFKPAGKYNPAKQQWVWEQAFNHQGPTMCPTHSGEEGYIDDERPCD